MFFCFYNLFNKDKEQQVAMWLELSRGDLGSWD